MPDIRLPTYPPKGSRRKLDEAWLDLLHRDGIFRHLPEVAEPPPELGRAIEEFNQGRYWLCHETLEGIWLPERYPLRLFYHALIKAAVGLLHLKRRNRHGALVKLADSEYTLVPFLPQFLDIDTARLHADIKNRWEYAQRSPKVDWDTIEKLTPVQVHSQSTP